jgi:3-oxoacyl-ACP reductase-like protein
VDRVRRYQFGRVAGVVLTALVATGCGTSDRDGPLSRVKVGQAERAVEEAKRSNASVTAAAELKLAEDKLAAARAAIPKMEYKDAITQAEAALADADYARARAFNEQMRKATDEAKKNIQVLRQELDRMPQ